MGFLVLVPALIIFALGMLLTLAFTVNAASHKNNTVYTISWMVAGVISSVAMVFSFVVFYFGGLGSDAERGALDSYKTPLGGGFYLLSIDSNRDLPLPLAHRRDSQIISANAQSIVSGLACLNGQTFLRFEEGYGRIDVPGRTLVRLNLAVLPASVQSETFWMNKQEFSRTECADVKVLMVDKVRNFLAFSIGPVFSIASLLGLFAWGMRIPTVPRIPKERSPDW